MAHAAAVLVVWQQKLQFRLLISRIRLAGIGARTSSSSHSSPIISVISGCRFLLLMALYGSGISCTGAGAGAGAGVRGAMRNGMFTRS